MPVYHIELRRDTCYDGKMVGVAQYIQCQSELCMQKV